MKHIVTLSHSPYIGGGELALKSLIDSTSQDYEWTVVAPGEIEIDPKVKPDNATIINIPNLSWWCYEAHDAPQPIDQTRLLKSLDQLRLIASSADILLTNTITIPWLGFIAQELQKPHIWYVHEFGDIDHNLQFIAGYDESLSMISECSSRILTISDAVKGHIGRVIPTDKIDIIHQSIDLGELIKIPALDRSTSTQRLLCLGAIKPSKGQAIALEAVAKLPELQLDIIGPAADLEYATILQAKAQSIPNVNVEVRSYNPIKELSKHEVLLMCSENEGLGRVTLEALAAGRIVVGYASPSTKELLSDSRGLLYSPNTSHELEILLKNLKEHSKSMDPTAGRKYVSSVFSTVVQARDFTSTVTKALKLSPEKTNSLNSYTQVLQQKNLWMTPRQRIAKKVKNLLPAPLRRTIKKLFAVR